MLTAIRASSPSITGDLIFSLSTETKRNGIIKCIEKSAYWILQSMPYR